MYISGIPELDFQVVCLIFSHFVQQEVAWSLLEHFHKSGMQDLRMLYSTVRRAKGLPYIDLKFVFMKVPLFGPDVDLKKHFFFFSSYLTFGICDSHIIF